MALSMWPPAGNKNPTTSTNPLSSSSSSPSHSSSSPDDIPATRKSLEEVWTGIKLSSLHQPPFHATGLSLQDLFSKDPPPLPSRRGSSARRPPPPSAAVLNLTSAPEFHLLAIADRNQRPQTQTRTHPVKRASDNGDDSGDRRHKRMIKNRESASRSRARKQAYTNQLENEVARLLEENEKLRIQLEKFSSMAPAQLPKKQTLNRTLTAPF